MKCLNRMDPDLRRLYAYFLPYKGLLILSGIFLVASASTSSITATLLGKLVDAGFYEQQAWIIWATPVALIAVTLLSAVCTVASSFLMAKISQHVLVTLRTALFERFLHWPSQEYQNKPTGLVSSKFVNEAAIALGGAAQSVIILVRDSIQVAALMGVLFWYNWQLTLVTFLVGPGLVIILRLISKRVRKIVKDSQATVANMISRVQESYKAERVVKVANTYEFEEERFAKVNSRIGRLALKTIKMQSLSTPLTQMLTMLAIAFVVGVAILEAQNGLLTIGEFVTFLSALLLIKAPIQHLAGLNSTFASISVAAKSIFDMLDTECEKDNGTKVIDRSEGNIVFNNIVLRYPEQDHDALKGLTFSIKAGEHVALVGASGSGKTSIINLIPRFWEVTSGSITLDGIDIRELTLESLRKQISIVTQDPVLFDGTLRENILYGNESATEESLSKAIDLAGLRSFVDSKEEGLNLKVGENGSQLSGGQRQRVSIARALLKDAPILIFDEATSALDSETEQHIKESIERLKNGRTCITVAHRFSSIEKADRVIVMQGGLIKEMGTLQELLKSDGMFRKLFELQNGVAKYDD